MNDGKYALRYTLTTEANKKGFAKEEIDGKDHGGADAIILVSILRERTDHDGAKSFMVLSADGQNDRKEISDREMFQAWSMIAESLSRSETLGCRCREIADHAMAETRAMVLSGRRGGRNGQEEDRNGR